jgi:hypothetical protein
LRQDNLTAPDSRLWSEVLALFFVIVRRQAPIARFQGKYVEKPSVTEFTSP